MKRTSWTVVAALSVGVVTTLPIVGSVEEKLQLSGRRNGTVHGPGTFDDPPFGEPGAPERSGILDRSDAPRRHHARFVPVRSFHSRCEDGQGSCEQGGHDHVVGAAGLRNAGYGTLRVRGAPSGAVLVAAYLYVGLIEDLSLGGGSHVLSKLTFQGHPVDAKRVARHGDHCWETAPGVKLVAEATLYRADVTGLIPPLDINGDYFVDGAPSGVIDGSNPFRCPAFLCNPIETLAQGATVVVIYRHPSIPLDSVVYLHEAAEVVPFLTSHLRVDHSLNPAAPPHWSELRFTSIGGDGQTRDPDPIFEPVAPLVTELEHNGQFGRIRGPGSRVEPNADWIGLDGGTVPQLWDTRTTRVYRHELPGVIGMPSLTTYAVNYEALADPTFSYDCVNPSAHVLSFYASP